MKMRVADYLTSKLYEAGGEDVFLVTGGMIIPTIVVAYGFAVGARDIGLAIFLIAVILQLIGDPLLRYSLMRTGYYPGIFPGTPSDFR